ncbi:nitrogenase stabilizing/protective protein [Methyloceanibacter methanicus]|uniref:Nitrogenase-stabilizing/protective protein NifW n=1 Tax=Methyloceanibacter methanicus TaxID=1774968 RepID=A0A1E3VYE3_9HYPH|nr:nitrogenase stabilizing/protective protein NifW [Methyloceanibacter methanicus]ODR97936.1 nitrogenase stabilizing/protective protein [Methyloceanibacter methanicus]
MTTPDETVLDKLHEASAAEEFFDILGVAYDPKVVNVARLHILRRMAEYLASEDIEGIPATVAEARCKAVLERAYEDFVRSSPIDERVFKVHKEAIQPKAEPEAPANFVSLDSLK